MGNSSRTKWMAGVLLLSGVISLQGESTGESRSTDIKEATRAFYYFLQVGIGLSAVGQSAACMSCEYDAVIGLAGFAIISSSLICNGMRGIKEMEKNQPPLYNRAMYRTKPIDSSISKNFLYLLYHGMEVFIGGCFVIDAICYAKKGVFSKMAKGAVPGIVGCMLVVNGSNGLYKKLKDLIRITKRVIA